MPSYYSRHRRTPEYRARHADPVKWESFLRAQPTIGGWILENRNSFGFAASMQQAVMKFGDLTPNQYEAIERCMAHARSRAQVVTVATTLDTQAVRDAIEARQQQGGRKAKIMIAGFEFLLAPEYGKNPGAIYIKDGGTYIGKVARGSTVFQPSRDFDRSRTEALQDACRDPAGAVRRHAEETARLLAEAQAEGRPLSMPCGCCGLTLTDPVSIRRGIGPICAGKWGF